MRKIIEIFIKEAEKTGFVNDSTEANGEFYLRLTKGELFLFEDTRFKDEKKVNNSSAVIGMGREASKFMGQHILPGAFVLNDSNILEYLSTVEESFKEKATAEDEYLKTS